MRGEMGREIRMVPKDWRHPAELVRGIRGAEVCFVPLHDGFNKAVREWDEGAAKWAEGLVSDYDGGWKPKDQEETYPWEEYAGKRPVAEDYMPDWPKEQRTHLMMYENTSEGTPISPAFETPEQLARWLYDNRASAFGSTTATYEQWLATCRYGYACSAVISRETGLISGVEASERFGHGRQ